MTLLDFGRGSIAFFLPWCSSAISQAMVAARDRTLKIEEQLEMLGNELAKEQAATARERRKAAQLSTVRAGRYAGATSMVVAWIGSRASSPDL